MFSSLRYHRGLLAAIMVVIASYTVSCVIGRVGLAQDLGWAEWNYWYDNRADWSSTGAYGWGRTSCYNKLNYSVKPQYLKVELWLYRGQELADHSYLENLGIFNEVNTQVEGAGSQSITWWFCAYHVCRPTLDLWDEWYTDYAVPGSGSKTGPTSTALDLQASSYYLQLLGNEVTITSEPTRICNVLSGRYALPEHKRKALLRLYVDELAPAYHNKPGDIMPGFFGAGGSYGIVFPHETGDYHVVMLDWNQDGWGVRSVYHGGDSTGLQLTSAPQSLQQ